AHGTPYQLQVPFLTSQGLATALLAIEPDPQGTAEKGEQEQGHSVFFQFDLEGFGQTRIDTHVRPGALRAVFYIEQPKGLDRLQSAMPAFQDRLQSLGYDEVLLAANPLGQLSTDKKQKFATLAAGIPTSRNVVDVRA